MLNAKFKFKSFLLRYFNNYKRTQLFLKKLVHFQSFLKNFCAWISHSLLVLVFCALLTHRLTRSQRDVIDVYVHCSCFFTTRFCSDRRFLTHWRAAKKIISVDLWTYRTNSAFFQVFPIKETQENIVNVDYVKITCRLTVWQVSLALGVLGTLVTF